MALVHYEDSDDDNDGHHHTSHHASQTIGTTSSISHASPANANAPALKRKRNDPKEKPDLPPLPASFHDLYSTNTRVSTRDDPSLHGGRKRSIPHVEGNWATHVYLECKANSTLITNHHLFPIYPVPFWKLD
jgi:U6 snRNA phosphodiesterase